MTLSEARKLAVDEAASEISLGVTFDDSGDNTDYAAVAAAAVEAYERAMAEAGWRMARVPDLMTVNDGIGFGGGMRRNIPNPPREWTDERLMQFREMAGWNACRAAMLGDGE